MAKGMRTHQPNAMQFPLIPVYDGGNTEWSILVCMPPECGIMLCSYECGLKHLRYANEYYAHS